MSLFERNDKECHQIYDDDDDDCHLSWIVSQELKSLLHEEHPHDTNNNEKEIIMKKKKKLYDYIENKANEIVETYLGVELDINAMYYTPQKDNNDILHQTTTTQVNHQNNTRNDELVQNAFNDLQFNSLNYKTMCTSAQTIIHSMKPNDISTIHQTLLSFSLDTNNDNHDHNHDETGRKKLKTNQNSSTQLVTNEYHSTTFTSFSLFDMMDRQDFSSSEKMIGIRQLLDTIISSSSTNHKYNLEKVHEFLCQCETVSDLCQLVSLSSETEWDELMTIFHDLLHPRMIPNTKTNDNNNLVIRLSQIHTKWFRLFHQQGQEGEYMGQQIQCIKNILTAVLQYSTTKKSFSNNTSKWQQQTMNQDALILKHLVQNLHTDMILSNLIQLKPGSPFEDELIQICSMCFQLLDTQNNNTIAPKQQQPCTTLPSALLAAIDPFSEWFTCILKAITIPTTIRIIQQNPYLVQHHLERIENFLSSSEYDDNDAVKTMEDTVSSLCKCEHMKEMSVVQSVSILNKLVSTLGCKLLLQLQEMNADSPLVEPLSFKTSEKEDYHGHTKNDNYHSIQSIFALVNPFIFLLKESFNPSNLSIFKLKQHVSSLVHTCRQCIELVFSQYAEHWDIVEPIFNHFVALVTNQPTSQVQSCTTIQVAVDSFFHVCKSILSRNPWETVTFQCKSQNKFFVRFETSIYNILHFLEIILANSMSRTSNHEVLLYQTGKRMEYMTVLPCILQNFILRKMKKRKDFIDSLRNILVITKGENTIWFYIFSTLLNQFEGLYILDDFDVLSDSIHQICYSLYATLSSGQFVKSSNTIQLMAHLCMTREGCLGLLRHPSFPHIRVSFFKIRSAVTKRGVYPIILKYFHDMIQFLLMSPWFPVALRLRDAEATQLVHDLKNDLKNLNGQYCATLSELVQPLLSNLNILTEIYEGHDYELIQILCESSKTNIGVSSEPIKSYDTDSMTIDSSLRDGSSNDDDDLSGLCDKLSLGSTEREKCKRLLPLCNKLSMRPTISKFHMANLLQYLSADIAILLNDEKCCEMGLNDSNSDTNFHNIRLIKTIMIQCGFSKIHSNDVDTDLNNYTTRHTIEYNGILYKRIDWFSISMLVLFDDFSAASNEIEAYYRKEKNKSGFDLKEGCERDQLHRLLISAVMDILEIECPEMLSAFHICQTPLSLIIAHWLNHSFVGVLNFREAILLNCIRLLEGYDFAIYYTVALVRYLQDDVFKCASSFDPHSSNTLPNHLLSIFMSPQSLHKYNAVEDFDYLCNLRNKHQPRICHMIQKI